MNVALFGGTGVTLPLRCVGARVLASLGKSAVVHVLGQDEAALELVNTYPRVVVHVCTDDDVTWTHRTVQIYTPPWKYRCHPTLVEHRVLLHRLLHSAAYGLLFGEPTKIVAHALRQVLRRTQVMLIDVEQNAADIEIILKMMSK